MNYNILSENLESPLLKELLLKLDVFFRERKIPFYIIGATARDFILCHLNNLPAGRKTSDLDIAIAIEDWARYQEIEQALSVVEGFVKDAPIQRFKYKGMCELDIVPFGKLSKNDGYIYWPPDESRGMTTAGYSQMSENAIHITIDGDLHLLVASIPGLFLLKIFAWKDRCFESRKDAYDIALILCNYLDINTRRAIDSHYDLYESDQFDQVLAGSMLLGRDLHHMLIRNHKILVQIVEILHFELSGEESFLVSQIVESNPLLKYDQIWQSLSALTHELEGKI